LAVILTLASPTFWAGAQGVWHGGSDETKKCAEAASSQMLVMDTGGRGGADIRQDLHSVAFWNGRLGWSAGYGGVFRTNNGGLTWNRMRSSGGWYHVVMTGPGEIWVLGGEHPGGIGKVWLSHSVDDGTTWQEVLVGQLGSYSDLAAANNNLYVLCSNYTSFFSPDGGKTWKQINFCGTLTSANQISIPGDVAMESGQGAIYVLGAFKGGEAIVRSDDGCQTWTVLETPSTGGGAWRDKIFFATSQRGWFGSRDGLCYVTDNGGQSWQPCPLPVQKQITALWFDQLGRGFAGVVNGDPDSPGAALYETADGGKSWKLALSGAKQINAFAGMGPGKLWAVGNAVCRVPNDLVVLVTKMPSLLPAKADTF